MDFETKVAFLRKSNDFFIRVTMMFVTALTILYFYFTFGNPEIFVLLIAYLLAISFKGLLMVVSKKNE